MEPFSAVEGTYRDLLEKSAQLHSAVVNKIDDELLGRHILDFCFSLVTSRDKGGTWRGNDEERAAFRLGLDKVRTERKQAESSIALIMDYALRLQGLLWPSHPPIYSTGTLRSGSQLLVSTPVLETEDLTSAIAHVAKTRRQWKSEAILDVDERSNALKDECIAARSRQPFPANGNQRSQNGNETDPPLTKNDVAIMDELAKRKGIVAKVLEITCFDRKIVGKCLTYLNSIGYVKHPDGSQQGWVLTDEGLHRLERLPAI